MTLIDKPTNGIRLKAMILVSKGTGGQFLAVK